MPVQHWCKNLSINYILVYTEVLLLIDDIPVSGKLSHFTTGGRASLRTYLCLFMMVFICRCLPDLL